MQFCGLAQRLELRVLAKYVNRVLLQVFKLHCMESEFQTEVRNCPFNLVQSANFLIALATWYVRVSCVVSQIIVKLQHFLFPLSVFRQAEIFEFFIIKPMCIYWEYWILTFLAMWLLILNLLILLIIILLGLLQQLLMWGIVYSDVWHEQCVFIIWVVQFDLLLNLKPIFIFNFNKLIIFTIFLIFLKNFR